MHPKRKSYRRTVTALVEADTTFLSVVDRGASGSPFTCVKHEDKPMKINRRTVADKKTSAQKSNKTVKTTEKRKADESTETKRQTMIISLSFDKESFPTIEDAKTHMANSDFEGEIEYSETDDAIVAMNKDAEGVEFIRKESIETDDEGVSAEVGAYLVELDEKSTKTKADAVDEDEDDAADDAGEEDDDAGEEGEEEDEATKGYDDKKKPKDSKKAEAKQETQEEPATMSKREQFLANLRKTAKTPMIKFDHYEVWYASNADTSFGTLLKAGMSDGAAPSYDDIMWTFNQAVRKSLSAGTEGMKEALMKDASSLIDLVVAQNELFNSVVNSTEEDVKKADTQLSYDALQKWATDFGFAMLEDDDAKPDAVRKSHNNPVITTKSDSVDVEKLVSDKLTPIMDTMDTLAKTVEKMSSRKQLSKSVPSSDASTDETANPADAKKAELQKAKSDEIGNVVFGR